jgi:crossover junction endodeoxyribonuclease RuvC
MAAEPLVLGIDPGARGACAVLDESGQLLALTDMPYDLVERQRTIRGRRKKINVKIVAPVRLAIWIASATDGREVVAAVEKVGARPGEGASSSFDFGDAYGKVLGVLAGLGIRTTVYRPQLWKGLMGLSTDKDDSRIMAATCWPGWVDEFRLKKHDGRAEAALIGEYHRRLTKGW